MVSKQKDWFTWKIQLILNRLQEWKTFSLAILLSDMDSIIESSNIKIVKGLPVNPLEFYSG